MAGLLRIFLTFAPVIAACSCDRAAAKSIFCPALDVLPAMAKSNQRSPEKKVIMVTGIWRVNWPAARLL